MRRIVAMAAVGLALVAAGPASSQGGEEACLREVIGQAPPPVAAFIRRSEACMVWNGDEPISAKVAHSPKTPARIRALNCDRLAPDQAALRKQFAHNRAALKALDRSNEQLC